MKKENDMTDSPPITRFIGEAERTLQALLQRQLQKAGMTFPEWVALTLLSGGQLSKEGLAQAIAGARVVAPGSEMTLVNDLIGKELVARGQNLSMTQRGLNVFQPLRDSMRCVTSRLAAGVSSDDLAVTRRVLETVTSRAVELLRKNDAHE
jgi:DNA-binding MarR family transcriptional regulator